MIVEENGIRQISSVAPGKMTSKMIEIETGKEVFKTTSYVDSGRTDIELIDIDFWDITIDGEEATKQDLESLEGGHEILALMNDRTIKIKSN